MFRRASHLLLLAGLLTFSQHAAAASKVVALLIGNDSLDLGLKQGDLNVKLDALRANLFNYGDESIISGGVNLPKEDMQARIREFQDRLRHKVVVKDHICQLNEAMRFDGEQVRIAGACAD